MPDQAIVNRVRARLLKEYPPSQAGMWQIHGEDPNCDLGEPHVEPLLEIVEGRYEDVVEHALTLDGFINWGAGGNIKPVRVTKTIERKPVVDRHPTRRINLNEMAQRRSELRAEQVGVEKRLKDSTEEFGKRLKAINDELATLG